MVTRLFVSLRVFGLFALLPLWLSAGAEGGQAAAPRPSISIPRLETAPTLEDFIEMRPGSPVARSMTRVEKFTQLRPRDGAPRLPADRGLPRL